MDTEPLCPGGEPRKTTCAQEENPEEGFSPPGSQESRSSSDRDSSPLEFKKKLNTEADFNKVVCQAVATSVVSSFTQKHRHPDFENAAYPTLLMSSKKCAIVIYDCTNDVLLITNVMELASDGSLNPEVLLLLWLVINYRSFLKYPSSIGNLASNIYAGIESSGRLSQYKSLNANNLCINTPKTKYVQMANDFPAKLLD